MQQVSGNASRTRQTASARCDHGGTDSGSHDEQRGPEHSTSQGQIPGCAVVTLYLQFATSVFSEYSDGHVVERSPVPRSPYDPVVLDRLVAARISCPCQYEWPAGIHERPFSGPSPFHWTAMELLVASCRWDDSLPACSIRWRDVVRGCA